MTRPMNDKQLKEALGYCGMFATCDTVQEAHKYVGAIADSCGKKNRIGVMTAAGMLQNSLIDHIARHYDVKEKVARIPPLDDPSNANLNPWRVRLYNDEEARWFFDCHAESDAHAREQALNAYPDAMILWSRDMRITDNAKVEDIHLFFKCEDDACKESGVHAVTPADLVSCGTPVCPHCDEDMKLQDEAEILLHLDVQESN